MLHKWGGDEVCTRKVIENNKHLKLITFMGTGYQKYIDVDAAKEYNIPVSYTPSANAKAVAEHTVALILDSAKNITYLNNKTKAKEWDKCKTFNLENKTLGIIGMGAIGSYITKIMCDGFGMKVIYYSRTEKEEINKKYNTKMVSLKEVFEKADIISINATYTKETENMIDKNVLDLMKNSAILVNTARQELVNRKDLLEVMKNKNIKVAMDGFYEEPITQDTKDDILDMTDDKILITSHNAYNSKDAVLEMERMIIESLEDIKNNMQIRNTVK